MKKFVLVPYQQWQECEKLQHLDSIDSALLSIIKRTDLEAAEKIELYKNITELQRQNV
jgi:hypothetical protein